MAPYLDATIVCIVVGICQLAAAGPNGPEDHAVARAAAEVLGISPAADLREVAAAFRRGSFQVHPEASNSQDSDQPRPRVAYETLCEAALALSALQRELAANPAECAATSKQSSLAVTELLLAAQRGDTNTVLATMRGPCFTTAWIEARDVFGLTPLHWAARQGHAHLALVLIEHGASLESRTSSAAYGGSVSRAYHTPLMMAASHGHAHVADVLLNQGALVGPHAADGVTDAMALACRGGHKTVVGVLLDHAVVAVPKDCSLPPKQRGELGMHAMLRQMRRQDVSAQGLHATADTRRRVGDISTTTSQHASTQTWDLPAFNRFLALRPHQAGFSPQLLFNSLDSDRSGVLDPGELTALPRYLTDEL